MLRDHLKHGKRKSRSCVCRSDRSIRPDADNPPGRNAAAGSSLSVKPAGTGENRLEAFFVKIVLHFAGVLKCNGFIDSQAH